MPTTTLTPSALDSLQRLTELAQHVEGFPTILDALKRGHSATIDGAWGSSATLAAAALARHAPRTLLLVLAHPRDVDGVAEELTGFTGTRPAVFAALDETTADELDEPTTPCAANVAAPRTPAESRRNDDAGSDPARAGARRPRGQPPGDRAGHGRRSGGAVGVAGGPRLPAHRGGRAAGRVQPPRRYPRRLPARRRRAVPPGVLRRRGRVGPAVRAQHPAQPRRRCVGRADRLRK